MPGCISLAPRDVEDVLYEHPAVREAAVIGIPDEYRGETVKAFVSLRPGFEATTPDELIEHCKVLPMNGDGDFEDLPLLG